MASMCAKGKTPKLPAPVKQLPRKPGSAVDVLQPELPFEIPLELSHIMDRYVTLSSLCVCARACCSDL